jgi:L-ascorbate metabolism protein UlaG (beta-lactamase superfamily)
MKTTLKWIGGASWILTFDNFKIACDPVLCPKGHVQNYRVFESTRLNEPIYKSSDFEDIGLWLLTHNHEDHSDNLGLDVIARDAKIVAHESLKPVALERQFSDITYLEWNKSTTIQHNGVRIGITAIPAIHAYRKIFSTQIGNGNGFLVEIAKEEFNYTIYVTGDSVFKKSRIKSLENQNIDLIVANIGSAMIGKALMSKIIGRVTNNISDLIKLKLHLKPKLIIPVHWGTFSHYTERPENESFAAHPEIKLIEHGSEIILN